MGTKKIFLVEDNPDHALLIRHSMDEDASEVVHYSDGRMFLDFLAQPMSVEEMPSLVFLDLKLIGMDGFEVLEKIRANQKFRWVPVVILTTSKRKEEVLRAYSLGANGFITKPEDLTELVAKLARARDYWLKTVEKPAVAE